MNSEAKKWMERAGVIGNTLWSIANDGSQFSVDQHLAVGRFFADLARLHIDAGMRVEATLEQRYDGGEAPKVDKPAPAAPAVKRFGKWGAECKEVDGEAILYAYDNGLWRVYASDSDSRALRSGGVLAVDPADPRPILDRARAAAEDAARAAFGACEFGCAS